MSARLEEVKDNDEAVKAYGVELAFAKCAKQDDWLKPAGAKAWSEARAGAAAGAEPADARALSALIAAADLEPQPTARLLAHFAHDPRQVCGVSVSVTRRHSPVSRAGDG